MELQLKNFRNELDLSQQEISKVTSIGQPTLSMLENKPEMVENITLKTLLQLADYFSVSLDELLDYKAKEYKLDPLSLTDDIINHLTEYRNRVIWSMQMLEKARNKITSRSIQTLIDKIIDSIDLNPYPLVIIGQENSKKSILVNTLLGRDVIPDFKNVHGHHYPICILHMDFAPSFVESDRLIIVKQNMLQGKISNLYQLKRLEQLSSDEREQYFCVPDSYINLPDSEKEQCIGILYADVDILKQMSIIEYPADKEPSVLPVNLQEAILLFLCSAPACKNVEEIYLFESLHKQFPNARQVITNIDYYTEDTLKSFIAQRKQIRNVPDEQLLHFSVKVPQKNTELYQSVLDRLSELLKSSDEKLTRNFTDFNIQIDSLLKQMEKIPGKSDIQNIEKDLGIWKSQITVQATNSFIESYKKIVNNTFVNEYTQKYKTSHDKSYISTDDACIIGKELLNMINSNMEQQCNSVLSAYRNQLTQYYRNVNELQLKNGNIVPLANQLAMGSDDSEDSMLPTAAFLASADLAANFFIYGTAFLGPLGYAGIALGVLSTLSEIKSRKDRESKLISDIVQSIEAQHIPDRADRIIKTFIAQTIGVYNKELVDYLSPIISICDGADRNIVEKDIITLKSAIEFCI